jgi:hypothetical protein
MRATDRRFSTEFGRRQLEHLYHRPILLPPGSTDYDSSFRL